MLRRSARLTSPIVSLERRPILLASTTSIVAILAARTIDGRMNRTVPAFPHSASRPPASASATAWALVVAPRRRLALSTW